MPWSTSFANALLQLILWNNNIANVGDATGLRGSTTVGNLWAFLATADPGPAGTAVTNECAYTPYTRVSLARSNTIWNIANNVANPIADIAFAMATAGSETATHWGITTASSGSSVILLRGTISPSIVIAANKTPVITSSSTLTLPTA